MLACYEEEVFEIGDAFYNHTLYLITTKTCRYEVLLLLGGDALLFIFSTKTKRHNERPSLKPSISVREEYFSLTALVPTPLWRGGKKNAPTQGRIAYRLKERKRSRCFVRTLLIKDFKYGPSLSLLTEIIIRRNGRKVSQFFTLTNNKTAEFDSGSKFKE